MSNSRDTSCTPYLIQMGVYDGIAASTSDPIMKGVYYGLAADSYRHYVKCVNSSNYFLPTKDRGLSRLSFLTSLSSEFKKEQKVSTPINQEKLMRDNKPQ